MRFETREASGDAKPTLQVLAASCSDLAPPIGVVKS
jgi:hypothetical protein